VANAQYPVGQFRCGQFCVLSGFFRARFWVAYQGSISC
jgi:hypothetical protein